MKSVQAQTASMIRKELKTLLSSYKFSVKADSASMMTAVRISGIDIPNSIQEQVSQIAKKYQYGHFDGMTDSYEYSNRNKNIPQVTYVTFYYDYSDEFKQAILDKLVKKYSIKENVSINGMHKQYVTLNKNFGPEVLSDLFYRELRKGI